MTLDVKYSDGNLLITGSLEEQEALMGLMTGHIHLKTKPYMENDCVVIPAKQIPSSLETALSSSDLNFTHTARVVLGLKERA